MTRGWLVLLSRPLPLLPPISILQRILQFIDFSVPTQWNLPLMY